MEIQTSSDPKNTQVIDPVDKTKATETDTKTPSTDTPVGDFSEYMKTALGGAAKSEVNEEELFASLIEQRLSSKSPEAAEFYKQEKARFMTSMARADGYVSVEDVALSALKSTVTAGKIDVAAAEQINGEAFAGAQLDSNLDMLFDGRGSGDDPTIAVSNMEAALLSMRTIIDAVDKGETTIASRSLDMGATGGNLVPSPETPIDNGGIPVEGGDPSNAPGGSQGMDGKGGFVWKPVSESNGNLVVLLPTSLRGLVDKLEIHSSLPPTDASKIASGKFDGDDKNGNRPHFRFGEPGAEYGDNLHVVAFKSDGSTVTWDISNGADRHD